MKAVFIDYVLNNPYDTKSNYIIKILRTVPYLKK